MMRFTIKRIVAIAFCLFVCVQVFSQDTNLLLQQAKNFELKFDESGALEKYKAILASDSLNINALIKCAELSCSIGERQKDKILRATYFNNAAAFANSAYSKDSSNSDVCYAMALANYKLTEIDDSKQQNDYIKKIKTYADQSLTANANNAKANYILGKWHFDLIKSSWLKRSPIKSFYNSIPDTQIDSATYYMERSRVADPYFAINYLDLAKAYQYDHQPAKALDVLNKLVRLPNRTFDDAAIKNEGKQMLSGMQ